MEHGDRFRHNPCYLGPFHRGRADGVDDPQIWTGPAKILNKQARTADRG
jgi:hypothetical protein